MLFYEGWINSTPKAGAAHFFCGAGIQQQWQMKRDMLSPRYTMRFSDLFVVRLTEKCWVRTREQSSGSYNEALIYFRIYV